MVDPLRPAAELLGRYQDESLRVLWFFATFTAVYGLSVVALAPAVRRVVRSRNRRNPTLVDAVAQYVNATMAVVAFLLALTAAGFGHVIADSAIVVAAVTVSLGVAGQAVIGNVISGVFLVADPDFNVDDWIEWDGNAGTVEEVALRVTRVRTVNNEVITVPNAELTTSAIRTPYARERYRVTLDLYVSYEDDLDRATEVTREAVREQSEALADPPPAVNVVELGPANVALRAQCWVSNPKHRDIRRVRSQLARRVKARLVAAGVDVAPPSTHELSGGLDVSVDRDRAGPGDG
ncbi:MAG: mechanosensitive ion channel family protein [Halobacteriaceae archaeon]